MNILLIGSGGREHTLAWKLAQSPKLNKLFIAPGNAGTGEIGQNVVLDIEDEQKFSQFCTDHMIDMIIVGPELPLVNGLYDRCKQNDLLKDILFIGPSKEGAQLEGSKAFAKEFMIENHIPTAAYQEFSLDQLDDGYKFLDRLKPPYVLKADGLAAGKGVLILEDLDEAKSQLKLMLEGKFGEASARVVIEEFLDGLEFSVFALTDGSNFVLLPEAKDYKRIGEADTGLNTGGMGAVSPVPFVDSLMMNKVLDQIVKPTINGINNRGFDYFGIVFFGLIEVNGEPKVIEYNCRLGDPETEAILPRIKNDLVDLFVACANGKLNEIDVQFEEKTATTVMLVSGGYPEAYEKGKVISHLDKVENSLIFHAGCKSENEQYLTNGGRVMALTSFGNSLQQALEIALADAEKIKFDGKYFRRDIGQDLI